MYFLLRFFRVKFFHHETFYKLQFLFQRSSSSFFALEAGNHQSLMERIFLQFGEAANSSLIHLWNYFGELGDENGTKQPKVKTLIYSEKTGMKGIIQSETSEEAEQVINQKIGRWTDLNYYNEFPESSYKELNQFDASKTFISSFYDSKSKSTFIENFEEDTRKLAESCDWLEGFNFVSESCGSIGASTLQALEFLNDEYTKTSNIVLSFSERIKVDAVDSVNWENCDKFDGAEVGKALKLALTFDSISDQHVTFIPVSALSLCTWKPFNFDLTDARESSRFFSSIEFDLFYQQSVPGKGKFASLATAITNETFNFSTNQHIDSSLSKFRKVPIVMDSTNYQFETVDLVSYVDFDPNPFASLAMKSVEVIENRPRLIWQQLESAGVGDELAAGDYYQEILEKLHQIKDQSLLC